MGERAINLEIMLYVTHMVHSNMGVLQTTVAEIVTVKDHQR